MKTLAIAALLATAQGQNARAKEGLDIARGFLVGSATAEGFSDVPDCMQDLEGVARNGEAAIADFKKKDLNDIIGGVKQVAAMLDVVTKAEGDCKLMKADWAKIEKMAKTWHSPLTFAYHVGKDILINGKNIYAEINKAQSDYQSKNYYDFGVQIGKASAQILLGKMMLQGTQGGVPPVDKPKSDPKKQYAMKMGSEYAAGFLYGAKVGGFDEKALYACLGREDQADKIFMQADQDLKTSIYKKDPKLAVKGLDEMMGMIIDMAMEQEKGKQHTRRGTPACPELRDKAANWNDARIILQEMKHPDTGLMYKDDKFMFNGQDISKEVDWMADSFMKHDFKKLGYLLGDTLDTHMKRNEKRDDMFLY